MSKVQDRRLKASTPCPRAKASSHPKPTQRISRQTKIRPDTMEPCPKNLHPNRHPRASSLTLLPMVPKRKTHPNLKPQRLHLIHAHIQNSRLLYKQPLHSPPHSSWSPRKHLRRSMAQRNLERADKAAPATDRALLYTTPSF